ncbi:MAG: serine/threonine-protein kinase, partial [Acidobacteriota bacterium]
AEQFQADLLLYKPFSEDDLRQAVGRLLSGSMATPAPSTASAPAAPPVTTPASAPPTTPAPTPAAEPAANPLTSADIFGDVLAEVEQEARKAERRGSRSQTPSTPPVAPVPSAATAPAPPPASPAPKPRARKSDIDRKLEETLSGVLPEKLRRPDKPRPKRRPKPTEDDIDSLLDKTLSSLELPRKVRRQKTAPSTPTPAPSAPTTPPVPAQTAALTPPATTTPTPRPPAPTSTPVPAAAPPAPRAPAPDPSSSVDPPTPTPAPAVPPVKASPPLADPVPTTPSAVPPPPPPSTTAAPEATAPPPQPTPAPTFAPPEIPTLDLEPTTDFELPPTEPAVPPTVSQTFEPRSIGPPVEAPSFATPTFEATPAESTPGAPAAGAPAAEPDAFDSPAFDLPEAIAEPVIDPPAFETFDTTDAGDPAAASRAEAEAPTGWSVTSFEDIDSNQPTPSPFATELVPSVEATPAPPTRSFTDDTFTDVEYPSDFAAAFAPAPESGDATSGALDQVMEVRDAAAPQDEGTPFGDYRLLDRVAVGGMAEVWRARRRGVEGFQKTVAIKRILYHLTGNDDFVTMFIDEAKLAAQLHHAHIVQIYDLGKVEDDFFIAMEYVDGKDLRTILNQANSVGRRLPVRLALEIVIAVARALDYAHRKKDDNDRDLGLVHRDVSPQNVLIGYESEIKLCDFGIVKAVVKASTTQMGALKGKLQYMSPEQAWGRDVDSRSDIFSLGSVLFEVLTGERLFTGDSEIGVLDAVRDGKVRSPREIVPDLPAAVEDIALRALTNEPDQRYQTADDMVRDLTAVLDSLGPASVSLGEFLNGLFPRA